jgi:hypothetical protein
MNDEGIEARLARWRPARPPSELMRRLHGAVPVARTEPRPRRDAGGWFGGLAWRPWPLAYAGLLAAWVLIFALRLTTPREPKPATSVATVQTDPAPADAPALAGTLAAERSFYLTRNDPDKLLP